VAAAQPTFVRTLRTRNATRQSNTSRRAGAKGPLLVPLPSACTADNGRRTSGSKSLMSDRVPAADARTSSIRHARASAGAPIIPGGGPSRARLISEGLSVVFSAIATEPRYTETVVDQRRRRPASLRRGQLAGGASRTRHLQAGPVQLHLRARQAAQAQVARGSRCRVRPWMTRRPGRRLPGSTRRGHRDDGGRRAGCWRSGRCWAGRCIPVAAGQRALAPVSDSSKKSGT
jgi:hypothetical protein